MKDHQKKIVGEALTYDDVLLVPAYSNILPKAVDIKPRFSRKSLPPYWGAGVLVRAWLNSYSFSSICSLGLSRRGV